MNTSTESIEKDLARLLTAQLEKHAGDGGRSPVGGATDLTRDLGLESIQIMEFVVDVEDHYDISIPLESLSKAHTVHDLALVVAREIGAGG